MKSLEELDKVRNEEHRMSWIKLGMKSVEEPNGVRNEERRRAG